MAKVATPKSETAFRTISEAAATIGVPQHVLRFWETRFPQLQPLKRGGNRRYYRPADMALLETIRAMLHDQGLTIRGAQLALAVAKPRAAAPAAQVPDVSTPHPTSLRCATLIFPRCALLMWPRCALLMVALRAVRDSLRAALAA